jgi:outer membrane protein assembly factor BamB
MFNSMLSTSLCSRNFLLASICLLAACGGGGGGGAGGNPTGGVSAPSALTYQTPDTYVAGVPIENLRPSVSGAVASYSVSPALPAGISLNGTSGELSGTPTVAAPRAAYRITALNSGGTVSFDLPIEVQAATVRTSPTHISRIVSIGTSVTVSLIVRAENFSFAAPLHARVNDPYAVIEQPVGIAANEDGSYTLTMTTNPSAAGGRFTSQLVLDLCRDASCAERQPAPSVTLPLDVNVMSATSPWPGDNLSTLEAWPDIADWQTFQGNPAHTGYVPANIEIDELSTRWSLAATGMGMGGYLGYTGTIMTAGERFFTSTAATRTVHARDEFDGREVWRYDFSDLQYPSVNPPAIANGTVYVAAGQQSSTYMHAFDAADGGLIFKAPMSSQWENYFAPTVGPEGVYTNAGSYGGMYGFTPGGQQLFFATLAQTGAWSPAVDNSGVYTYTDGTLQKFDAVTGDVLLSIAKPTSSERGTPVLGAPGSIFTNDYGAMSSSQNGTYGNMLNNFDVSANAIRWQVFGFYPTAVAYNDGVVYAANELPLQLEARSETNGELLWSWVPAHAGDARFISAVLLTNDFVFVSTNRSVYAVDRKNHKAAWSYPASGHLSLSRNGILYIETSDRLIAINVK